MRKFQTVIRFVYTNRLNAVLFLFVSHAFRPGWIVCMAKRACDRVNLHKNHFFGADFPSHIAKSYANFSSKCQHLSKGTTCRLLALQLDMRLKSASCTKLCMTFIIHSFNDSNFNSLLSERVSD